MNPNEIKAQRILIAPLNWGLGHATRSAKLIRILKQKNEVIIASDGASLLWLKNEFPDLKSIEFPELKIKYSKRFGAAAGILFRLPHFLNSINKDYKETKKLVDTFSFDLIISDNRYGVYNENCKSVLLSHQLNLLHPLSSFISSPFQILIEKFDEIWVPDDEIHSLSGDLSKPETDLKTPVYFIGPLSRFTYSTNTIKKDIKFLLIASGPEPFRQQLVDYFEANFSLLKDQCHIVYGANSILKKACSENITRHVLLNTEELESLIKRAEIVICRSGYSSIMDLIELKQRAVLIPTPGQSEQIYLAKYHSENPLFESVIKDKDLPSIFKKLL
jgi:UDP:flavonoid glycosyltransferase YjiC (YdhE family)